MSLITDVEYAVSYGNDEEGNLPLLRPHSYFRHRLRLAYLRHSDDPYAPRLVSFPANYDDNPYIRAAGLADVDRWPELQSPSSPAPTPHEEPTQYNTRGGNGALGEPSGKWPGATGLHYTQTIMGSRSGVAGMRVNGRRTSKGSPYAAVPLTESRSVQPQAQVDANEESTGSVAPGTSFPIKADGLMPAAVMSDLDLSRRRSSGGSTVIGKALAEDNGTVPAPATDNQQLSGLPDLPPLPPGFRPPKFARGAEMEARRRRRMQMRAPAKVVSIVEDNQPPAPRPVLLLDDTSSEEESAPPTVEGSVTTTESDADDAGEMPSDFEDVSFLRPCVHLLYIARPP